MDCDTGGCSKIWRRLATLSCLAEHPFWVALHLQWSEVLEVAPKMRWLEWVKTRMESYRHSGVSFFHLRSGALKMRKVVQSAAPISKSAMSKNRGGESDYENSEKAVELHCGGRILERKSFEACKSFLFKKVEELDACSAWFWHKTTQKGRARSAASSVEYSVLIRWWSGWSWTLRSYQSANWYTQIPLGFHLKLVVWPGSAFRTWFLVNSSPLIFRWNSSHIWIGLSPHPRHHLWCFRFQSHG